MNVVGYEVSYTQKVYNNIFYVMMLTKVQTSDFNFSDMMLFYFVNVI